MRCIAVLPLLLTGCGGEAITVASKNFTESIVLGEIVSQALEQRGFTVDRRFNLGGTFVCHEAMLAGQADVYVEYTGTAHAAILKLPSERNPKRLYAQVDSIYRARWNLEWTDPLGFDNTFAMLVRGADARRLGIATLSDAVPHARDWRPGFGYEFMERADGYRGLLEAYGLRFGHDPVVMDLGLTYRALAEGRVDVVAANATDGQISALDLVHLADDRDYFPPYDAAPVVRREVLDRHPEIRQVLASLGGTIDDATMRRMNHAVDVEKRNVREVAAQFLEGGTGVLSPFARAKAEALLRDKLPCLGCHQLGGEGGRIGPDLTGVGSRRSVEEIAAMIADPRGAVPASIMPQVPMPESWRTLIVTYLAGESAPAARAATPAEPVSGGSDADGGALYARYCAACHGTNGGGDGPNARYLPVRPTVHSDSAYMSERHDAALYDAIYAGGAIIGKSNRMPPFGFTLSSEEIGALVRHLRELCRCEGPAWSRD